TIDGESAVTGNGINFAGGGSLDIYNCTITGNLLSGIVIAATGAPAFDPSIPVTVRLGVYDSIISRNGASNTDVGILIRPQRNTSVRATIERTRVKHNNTDGILVDGTATTGNIVVHIR